MANPFKDTLDQVIDFSPDSMPELRHLEQLKNYLSHQEDKVYALDRGLLEALFDHYKRRPDDSSEKDSRLVIVNTVQSLVGLRKGRERLFRTIGIPRVLSVLKDASLSVRIAGCDVLGCLSRFPDGQDELLNDRITMETLTTTLLQDELEVGIATIPALSSLCERDPVLDSATILALVSLLKDHAPQSSERKTAQLCRHILQTLWNVSCDVQVKKVAIECGVVQATAPLLSNEDDEIRRLASGVISAVSVASQGKLLLLETPEAIKNLCAVALNIKASPELRDNAVLALRNLSDNFKGLHACGSHLIVESDIMAEILSPEQMAKIIARLLESKEYDRHALQALSLLVKGAAGRKASWAILDIVPRLHALAQGNPNQRVKGLSRRCLEALCADNPVAQSQLEKLKPLEDASGAEDGEKMAGGLVATETAILLVQYQNDYTMKAGVLNSTVLESMEDSQMLWNTVDLVEKARRKGAMVIYLPLRIEDDANDDKTAIGHFQCVLEEGAFKAGTWGAEITQELSPESEDVVLDGMNTLSGFQNTELDNLLRSKGLSNLVLCGLMGDAAVDNTLRDAYERGFNVLSMTDCIACSSSKALEHCVKQVFPNFSHTMSHNELLTLLQ